MTKNIIIGIGNILFYDDGVGVYAALYLEKNFIFDPVLEIIDGGTMGMGLLEYISEYDNIFLIDSISIDDTIGSIYTLPSDELLELDGFKNSAHEVEVVDMIRTASLLDKRADITLFGMVPKDIDRVDIGLSDDIKNNFAILINTVIDSIQNLDIKVTRKNNFLLEDIIKEKKC